MKKILYIAIIIMFCSFFLSACSFFKPDLQTLTSYTASASEAEEISVENAVYEDGYLLMETQKRYILTQDGAEVRIKLTRMSDSLWEEDRLVTEEYTESLSKEQVQALLPVNVGEKLDQNYFEGGRYSYSGNVIHFNVPDGCAAEYLNTEQEVTNLSVSVEFVSTKLSSYIASYSLPSGNTGRVKYVYKYAQ